jgi:hypothetical protein
LSSCCSLLTAQLHELTAVLPSRKASYSSKFSASPQVTLYNHFTMFYSRLFVAVSALASIASATSNFTTCCNIDPATVDSPTRAAWCRAQQNSCPELCPDGNAAVNNCDSVSLPSSKPSQDFIRAQWLMYTDPGRTDLRVLMWRWQQHAQRHRLRANAPLS